MSFFIYNKILKMFTRSNKFLPDPVGQSDIFCNGCVMLLKPAYKDWSTCGCIWLVGLCETVSTVITKQATPTVFDRQHCIFLRMITIKDRFPSILFMWLSSQSTELCALASVHILKGCIMALTDISCYYRTISLHYTDSMRTGSYTLQMRVSFDHLLWYVG